MTKKIRNSVAESSSGGYVHEQEAVQRPDVGVQPEFYSRKPPATYRYDSSLAPELSWDENAERDMAEWLFVTYRKTGGVPARYIPDFIAELDIGLNLIIETKGRYSDDADTKAKAAHRWVTAVNKDGNWGLWAYEVVRDPTELPLVIDKYSVAKWDANDIIGMTNQ